MKMADDTPKRKRRIVLIDVNGAELPIEMDVTAVPNANSQATLALAVMSRCDMGHWHRTEFINLNPWGAD
jgi:hypothetical protein